MHEVERGHCSGRFQVDIAKTAALYHFPFVKVGFFFVQFTNLCDTLCVLFGSLTNENGTTILQALAFATKCKLSPLSMGRVS